jgi:hypothetical protein
MWTRSCLRLLIESLLQITIKKYYGYSLSMGEDKLLCSLEHKVERPEIPVA